MSWKWGWVGLLFHCKSSTGQKTAVYNGYICLASSSPFIRYVLVYGKLQLDNLGQCDNVTKPQKTMQNRKSTLVEL